MAGGYRSIVVASQSAAWFVGQLLKLYFSIELRRPAGLFERGSESCLILASMHKSGLDPWIILSALRFREWRTLVPVRTMATQTFHGTLRWFKPLIRALYHAEGVIELPPVDEGGTLPEKAEGLLNALQEGDVVAIFPEGGVRKKRSPPDEFAPGVVYLQRRTAAAIVPIALWTDRRLMPRSRYVIEIGQPVHIPKELDLEDGAAWLRERMTELYDRARAIGERTR
jgi:1-acyl-sn-glycerol-3-phosphate acyltransferase